MIQGVAEPLNIFNVVKRQKMTEKLQASMNIVQRIAGDFNGMIKAPETTPDVMEGSADNIRNDGDTSSVGTVGTVDSL